MEEKCGGCSQGSDFLVLMSSWHVFNVRLLVFAEVFHHFGVHCSHHINVGLVTAV
jgi:hypothetical protein